MLTYLLGIWYLELVQQLFDKIKFQYLICSSFTASYFTGYARQAGHAEHAGYDSAEHDIDQEFLLEDFFDDIYDN
jgi:hypothetical protein